MDTPPVKKGFFRRLFSWRGILFVLAAFVTLVILLWAEENWRGGRAWHNYKLDLEAKGEHFDVARLVPPKVSDDQNLAALPFFTNADAGPYAMGSKDIKWPTRDLPPSSTWSYGQAGDLIGWAEAFHAPADNPGKAAANVLDYLDHKEPVLQELKSAGERPYCRFDVNYEDWGVAAETQLLPQLARTKQMARLLFLRAEAEMVLGQTDRAMDDIHLLFRMNGGLMEEPLLISQLVSYADMAIMLEPVGEGLAEHRWSDAQLVDLQEHLQKIDLLASLVHALYGERDICVNEAFDHGEYYPRFFPGWARLEQFHINRAMGKFVFPRIDLTAGKINPSVNHSIEEAFKEFSSGSPLGAFLIHHSIFAKMLLPAYSHVPLKTALTQSEVNVIAVACALERYRLAEGRYPETLDALVPRFAASLPHDIINGQPLKYRLTADGRFVLYSVGWNEKDDGGVVARKGKNQDAEHGDWVLEYPEEKQR